MRAGHRIPYAGRSDEREFEDLPIRAMDITEVAPPLDTNQATSFLGVQVVLETLAALT